MGRKRNCYGLTINNVHRALVYATKGRKLKKGDFVNVSLKFTKFGFKVTFLYITLLISAMGD